MSLTIRLDQIGNEVFSEVILAKIRLEITSDTTLLGLLKEYRGANKTPNIRPFRAFLKRKKDLQIIPTSLAKEYKKKAALILKAFDQF